MQFEFATAGRIVFGAGKIRELGSLAAPFGGKALVVTGKNAERAKRSLAGLAASGVQCLYLALPGEPTVEAIRAGAQAARAVDFVIGFGGGSAIDAAKAIAAVAPNSDEPLDYMEVVGKGRALESAPLPFIAIPTTAGTGAEVTRNAVIGSLEHQVKASIRSPLMLARIALVDPELTLGVSPEVTAYTGLDTITQLIEPLVSSKANAFVDSFCLDGLTRAAKALPVAFANCGNLEARTEMCFASLLSGLALANAGLGVIHGFAAPLGGMLNAPHGALCAAILPHGVAVNVRALRERSPNHPALAKYAQIAAILAQNPGAQAEDASKELSKLCATLMVPALRNHGLAANQIPLAVEKAAAASSMKANPLPLTPSELTEILDRSF